MQYGRFPAGILGRQQRHFQSGDGAGLIFQPDRERFNTVNVERSLGLGARKVSKQVNSSLLAVVFLFLTVSKLVELRLRSCELDVFQGFPKLIA